MKSKTPGSPASDPRGIKSALDLAQYTPPQARSQEPIRRPAGEFHSLSWMRGVALDLEISPVRRFILIRLCLYRRSQSGNCDVTYQTVADELGVYRGTVIRAVAAGAKRGWLAKPTSRGRTPNNFEFIFPNDEASNSGAGATVDAVSTVAGEPPLNPQRWLSDFSTVALPQLHHQQDQEDLTKSCGPSKSRVESEGPNVAAFALFWSVYPKHIGKHDAEKAFCTALKQATAEQIIAGARRYAGDPDRIERGDRYTKHPANWLRAGGWADEASDTGSVTIDQDGNPVTSPRKRSRPGSWDALEEKLIAYYENGGSR